MQTNAINLNNSFGEVYISKGINSRARKYLLQNKKELEKAAGKTDVYISEDGYAYTDDYGTAFSEEGIKVSIALPDKFAPAESISGKIRYTSFIDNKELEKAANAAIDITKRLLTIAKK